MPQLLIHTSHFPSEYCMVLSLMVLLVSQMSKFSTNLGLKVKLQT